MQSLRRHTMLVSALHSVFLLGKWSGQQQEMLAHNRLNPPTPHVQLPSCWRLHILPSLQFSSCSVTFPAVFI
jgi:hypothetical protein